MNPPQAEAVTTTEGPLLILAGAGSGKTRVLTHRIAYILEQKLAHPDEILAVTFTNKAAAEMRERVEKLLGKGMTMPWLGTFHALCVKLLKREGHHIGLESNFTIYDTSDQLDMMKTALDQLNISTKDVAPRAVLSYISTAKNELIDPEMYQSHASGYFQEIVAQVYPVYQRLLRENNALDFDDLLMYGVKLWQQAPRILERYQEQFKYIMVDEYQDTNHVQYMWINKLAALRRNICVVGDDDQSIYAFRGANIRNILSFERDYTDTKVVKLEQNYRSTQVILEAAYSVVKHNKQRTAKKLWTDQSGGDLISLYTALDEQDEARWVLNQISGLRSQGISADEIVILYRTNAQSRVLEEWCLRKTIPYRVVGGMRFYERKEIKDVVAYLRIIHNSRDSKSLERIINTPKRGIGPKLWGEVVILSQAKGLPPVDYLIDFRDSQSNPKLKEFANFLHLAKQKSKDLDLVEFLNYVISTSGYAAMLKDGTAENESRMENLQELLSVATGYLNLPPADALASFLDDVSLVESVRGKEEEGEAAITLMTIHAAKGLEFAHVFVVGVEEGLFPHSRVFTDPKELEEERRLAYVAITRAKRNLYLIHAESRLYFGSRQRNMVSRFVEDIPTELIEPVGGAVWEKADEWEAWPGDLSEDKDERVELKVGDKVRHEVFGAGKVAYVDDDMVEIDFGPVFGRKELARQFAPLQVVK